MQITRFRFAGPKQAEYELFVDTEDTPDTLEVFLRLLDARSSKQLAQVTLTHDLANKQFSISHFLTADPLHLCLLACGAQTLVREILDCWTKGASSPTDMLACLIRKGAKITAELAGCVVTCLITAGGGTGSTP